MTDQAKKSALLPVTRVSGRPIPLPGNDIDTDRIIPARFMTAITFDGLGELAFRDARFGADGKPLEHPMNDPRFRAKGPRVAIVNKNFGCGSSREHAPWALQQYGFKAIIAPSYADIFFNNCFKNGLLPIVLPEEAVDRLIAEIQATPGYRLTVDLQSQTVTTPSGASHRFEVEPSRKECLLNGWDEIGLTLRHQEAIKAYEMQRRAAEPWIFAQPGSPS